MKKEYAAPTLEVVQVKTGYSLLSSSITEATGSAVNMYEGSFGARDYDFDDED